MSKVINLYARSLYGVLSSEDEKVKAYECLRALVPAFEDKDCSAFFENPTVETESKYKALESSFEKLPASKELKNFILVLLQNNRGRAFKYIVEAYRKMLDDEFKIARGVVRASSPLSQEDQTKVEGEIKKLTGKRPLLTHVIDESLIGGVEVSVDQLKIDYSIQSQISKLNELLTGRTN